MKTKSNDMAFTNYIYQVLKHEIIISQCNFHMLALEILDKKY